MQYEIEEAIKKLTERAKDTTDHDEAMKFSQAALNLAHAIATFDKNKRENFGMKQAHAEYGQAEQWRAPRTVNSFRKV